MVFIRTLIISIYIAVTAYIIVAAVLTYVESADNNNEYANACVVTYKNNELYINDKKTGYTITKKDDAYIIIRKE